MYNTNYYSQNSRGILLPSYTRVTTRTSVSVISLDELKAHLLLFNETEYDDFLNRILIAGQELAESYIGEYLSDTTLVAYYPVFGNILTLDNQYVNSVSSVAFTDNTGASQTIDTARYLLDQSSINASVNLRRSQFINWTDLPLNTDIENPVRVTYVSSVPTAVYDELVRHAVLLYCASMFKDRENYITAGLPRYLPLAAERLLAPLKRRSV